MSESAQIPPPGFDDLISRTKQKLDNLRLKQAAELIVSVVCFAFTMDARAAA